MKQEMQTVSYEGETLLLVKDERLDWFFNELKLGKWEPGTFDFIRKYVDKNTTFVDVGAWIGVTPVWAARRARNVIAVEPEPYCCDAIEAAVYHNRISNLKLLRAALSDKETQDLFMVGGEGSSTTTLVPDETSTTVTVSGVSVDELCKLVGDNTCAIKVDIEGFEFSLISQLSKLSRLDVKAVQVALHPAIISNSVGMPWPFNRAIAAMKVYRLVRAFGAAFGNSSLPGYSNLGKYLAYVIFSKKCRGVDALFVPSNPA